MTLPPPPSFPSPDFPRAGSDQEQPFPASGSILPPQFPPPESFQAAEVFQGLPFQSPPATLPVIPTEYPNFWRTPAWRPLRVVLGILFSVILFFVVQTLLVGAAIWYDAISGRARVGQAFTELANGGGMTPAIFIGNNLSLAALILVAMMIGVLVFRQPAGWLVSVTGRMRWRWLGLCLAVLAPIWVLLGGVEMIGTPSDFHVGRDTWVLVVGILLTTPLQCAGEEFGFRGVVNRVFASIFRHRIVGAWVGAVVSAAVFMLAHNAGDIWLNVFYFSFGLITCYLVWVTGGLEASIAMHVVNNLLAEATLPFVGDISQMMNRSAGTAGPGVLVQLLAPVIGAVLITWLARRRGLVTATAPGQPVVGASPAEPEAGWSNGN